MTDRYIELKTQIIDREKIARLYWLERELWVVIPGEPDFSLIGEEASKVWRAFSQQPGWKDLTE